MVIDFREIDKLKDLLVEADIPHTFAPMFSGWQIRIYADEKLTNELDDAVIHEGSHGFQNGLLETFLLGGCEGWETAEQVFEGWLKMYQQANSDTE
jgi:galactokinase/mevalonate kinase-like predicted kinase